MFKEEKKRKKAMEKKQNDITGKKDKTASMSYASLAVYGVVASILLYLLWNWIVWKFFWTGNNSDMLGKKNN